MDQNQLSRRLGRTGGRWWQIATRWRAYSGYLEALCEALDTVRLPTVGAVRLDVSFMPVRVREYVVDDELVTGRRVGDNSPTSTLPEALAEHSRLLLIGPAGTGKSALLRWYATKLARAVLTGGRVALLAEGAPWLPLYVPLARTRDTGDDLEARLAATMADRGFGDASEFLSSHLATGRAVILLDDLDTLFAAERRAEAAHIEDLVQRYPGNRIVVATRDISDAAWFGDFAAYEVAGVDPRQLSALAGSWGVGHKASAAALLQVVERSPLVAALAARPGWFAIMLGNAAQAVGLPGTGAGHGPRGRPGSPRSSSGVAHNGHGIRLTATDVLSGFVAHLEAECCGAWPAVARNMCEERTTVGPAGDIPRGQRLSGLVQWLDHDTFRFIHRAVQVYFAATDYAQDPADVLALTEMADDPWWQPVLVLATSQLAAPRAVVERLIEGHHPAVAALALAELRERPDDLRRHIVVTLLRALAGTDPARDENHAFALAALLGSEAVHTSGVMAPALTALSDSASDVRAAAAATLGRLGNPAAIPPLLTALGDEDSDVRAAASDALAAFGARTVQPLVRQLSVANERVRQAAVRALAQQGTPAVGALLPYLEASSISLRTEAAAALAQVGEAALPSLIDILRGGTMGADASPEQLEAVGEALEKIGRPAAVALIPLLPVAQPEVSLRIPRIMEHIGPPAVDALGEALAAEETSHSAAAAAMLGQLPRAGARGARYLARALADPRFEVRYEARRGLRRLGAVASDTLLEVMAGTDEATSWEAAQLLADMPDPPIGPLLKKLNAMLRAGDADVRRKAVGALGPLTGPEVQAALISALGDADAVVRRSAVAQLGHIGDAEAAAALRDAWPGETDAETQLAILDALYVVTDGQAIPTLIDALGAEDDVVRRRAAALLTEAGEDAVVPLVEALNRRPGELDRTEALQVLEAAASATRAGGHSPSNLARAYYRLEVEDLDIEELTYLAATLEWWPPAQELHRTFASLREFLDYRTLAGIGNAEKALEWVDETDDWLRPAAGRALRQLRSISQAVQYFNRGARRRSKEKGLLAAADRLNSLKAMLDSLGAPHDRLFRSVADHWSGRVNDAIRELQGKAELQLDLRTDNIRIRDVKTTAVLVFELSNEGVGLASNIQLSIDATGGEFSLLSTPAHYLPPLGQADRITTEFTIRREGEGLVPVPIDVKYDDPQVEGQSQRFVREVRFFVEETAYKDIGTSPYIAGPPVKTPAMFYGREATFEWVQENLSGTYQDNVLVLYGERRTGKTSVLYQLAFRLPDEYAFVLTDLQSIAYALGSTSDLLYAMSRKLTNGLRKQGFDLERVTREDFAEHPIETFVELGEEVGDKALAQGRRAVLIVDEFDLLIEAVEKGDVSPHVFDCIRGLMQHQDGLSFVFAGAHKLSAMLKNPHSILFNTALRRKVSFLDGEDAERLIREPVKDVLWYEELAVEKILRVTAGQPYFIQYICHEIVNLARKDSRNFVTLRDVDRALQTTVEETTGIIRHSYMSLSRGEQLTLAALSSIADDGRPFVGLEDIAETLRQDNVAVGKRELFDFLRQLVDRDFIVERRGESASGQYGFAMDLVRVWLEQNNEYTRLVEEVRDEPDA